MAYRYLLVVVLLLALVGGTVSAQQNIIGPDTYPPGINPLTGLPVSNPDLLNRRPLIIKISNSPASVRPQSGLNEADMVWEHLLSGGVTRFSAIFLSTDLDHIGPVRSARLVDFELTRVYHGLFTYSGMAQGTLDVLRGDALMASRVVGGSGPCPPLCRFPKDGVALEHTLYADAAGLRELAVTLGRDVTPEPIYGMAFSETPPDGGVAADGITIDYRETSVNWTYDPASGHWFRSQDGEPHFDAYSNTRVNAANVLVLEEDHTEQPFVSDQYWGPGNFAFSVNFIGSGRIFLFRDGRYYEGEWRRATRDDPLTYYDLDGNVLPFKPGNTFVNLVPRWVDGYQLTFQLSNAPTAAVTGTVGVNMRKGPGTAYRELDVAYPGDTFEVVGRNWNSEWLQVEREGDGMVWMRRDMLDISDEAVAMLPIPRPTNER
ncbi:MAG: DUF3048 domain-containing protein [Anaerolineaceae bacterium]|nr:DUF3048 domain-containing protein [Anaerolineaceae bacterium]